MSLIDPTKTTSGDICTAALNEAGVIGQGQQPSGSQITDAQARLQWLLAEWNRKRWMIWHLVTLNITATGASTYTIGPGGDLDTGVGSVRPARLESAYLRQLQLTPPNQVDYPLQILQSMEDFNVIALKSMVSFPGCIFLDSSWPLGVLHVYPVPNASIYGVFVSIMDQLPSSFATSATVINLPYEYFDAMVSNLAIRLRALYRIGTFPGDQLPERARQTLATIRGANTQIARLRLPQFQNADGYNIFSDRF